MGGSEISKMKTKTTIAYEPESSVTIRLTPEDIGILISKCPNGDLGKIFKSLKEQTNIFSTKERKSLINTFIK